MSKTKKKRDKKGKHHNGECRPWQFIALLVVYGGNILVGTWIFYSTSVAIANAAMNDTVSPATMRAFEQLRMVSLLVTLTFLILWVLLLFNNKVSFWIWAVLSIGTAVYAVLQFNLTSILVAALGLYLIFCEPTRRWLRVGKFKTLPPHPKHKRERPQP